jgi:hypothetical protein
LPKIKRTPIKKSILIESRINKDYGLDSDTSVMEYRKNCENNIQTIKNKIKEIEMKKEFDENDYRKSDYYSYMVNQQINKQFKAQQLFS